MGLLRLTPEEEAMAAAWCAAPAPREAAILALKKAAEPLEATAGPLPGLANLGNTCFANSVLQCLLNTPGWFPEACLAFAVFSEGPSSQRSTKAALGRSFQRLAQEYASKTGGALQSSNSALREMKNAIASVDPKYAGCQQQDAYEFLGCLLEGLEEGFSALFRDMGGSSRVMRAICGISTHTRRTCETCSRCCEVDAVTDTALRLPLLSPGAQLDASLREREEKTPISLEELMEASRRPETIEDYDCEACRKHSAEKGLSHARSRVTQHAGVISATQDVLMVVLYRFGHALNASTGSFQPIKVKRQVAVPIELSLETGDYSLYGVVSHLGTSLSAGHYVAAVRSRRDELWYECNDEKVSPLNNIALYRDRAVTSVRQGAEPYILFYHRRCSLQSLDDFFNEEVVVSDLVAKVAVADEVSR